MDGPACWVLGGPPLRAIDGTPVALTRTQRRLLLALALTPRAEVPLASIERALWGDRPPADPRNRIQVAVSKLRRRMTEAGHDVDSIQIVTTEQGYRLDTCAERVDHERLRLVVEHERTRDPAAVDVDALRAVLDTWQGEPFADLEDDRDAQPLIAQLEHVRLTGRLVCAEALHAQGRSEAAIELLAAAHAEDLLDERTAAALMRVLAAVGRQAAAETVYQRTRDALRERLGMSTGTELEAQHRALLGSQEGAFVAGGPTRPRSANGAQPVATTLLARHVGRRFICVTGAPGAGKSRLVDTLSRRALEGGVTVLRGACYAGSPPLQALRDALRTDPDLRATTHEGSDPGWSVAERVEDGLRARVAQSPLLLVVEDLQWANDALCEVLEHLARTSDQGDLAVVMSFAAEEDDAAVAARTIATIARHSTVEHVHVGPLDTDELTALVRALCPNATPEEIEAIGCRSGHNAAAAEQLGLALAAGQQTPGTAASPLPMTRLLTQQQVRLLHGIEPADRAALVAAASATGGTGVATVEAVARELGTSAAVANERLASGLRRRILVPTDGGLRFRMPITAEVLCEPPASAYTLAQRPRPRAQPSHRTQPVDGSSSRAGRSTPDDHGPPQGARRAGGRRAAG